MELLKRYSKNPVPLKTAQILEKHRLTEPVPVRSRVHEVERRLSADTIQQLLDDYRSGTPTDRLTARYDLGKGTVIKLLKQHGVVTRRTPRLNQQQLDVAVKLYAQGWSAKAIGQEMGRSAETIRSGLLRSGVAMRPAGRPRRHPQQETSASDIRGGQR